MDLPCSHSRTEPSKYCAKKSKVARVKRKNLAEKICILNIIPLLTNTCYEKLSFRTRQVKTRDVDSKGERAVYWGEEKQGD